MRPLAQCPQPGSRIHVWNETGKYLGVFQSVANIASYDYWMRQQGRAPVYATTGDMYPFLLHVRDARGQLVECEIEWAWVPSVQASHCLQDRWVFALENADDNAAVE